MADAGPSSISCHSSVVKNQQKSCPLVATTRCGTLSLPEHHSYCRKECYSVEKPIVITGAGGADKIYDDKPAVEEEYCCSEEEGRCACDGMSNLSRLVAP